MARTRLDEIVEEVLSCWYSQSSPQMPPPTVTFSRDLVVSLMATSNEKAFRHGVEQMESYVPDIIKAHASKPFVRMDWAGAPPQPAPAGKRKCTCGGMIGAILGKAGPAVHRTDGPCFMDRRKGERRKGLECRQDPVRGLIPACFWFRHGGAVMPDFRSGKDRRKG